jgi:hypothetical protein
MSYSHMILGRALVAGLNQPRRAPVRASRLAHSRSELAAFERVAAGERKIALPHPRLALRTVPAVAAE